MLIQPALVKEPVVFVPPDAEPHAPVDAKSRGAVFTKPAVVEFMLDLVGYRTDAALWEKRLLEPACGDGGFLLVAAGRLVTAWQMSPRADDDSVLDDAIRAVELDAATFHATRRRLVESLATRGLPELSALRIARKWLTHGDFLLCRLDGIFDFAVGNPPYVRQELIPADLLARYKSMYRTMVGRADVYVPFFERALSLLGSDGALTFICADAWTKNDYGRVLREIVTSRYGLSTYVDMYGLDTFEASVGAYPSITVIGRARETATRTAVATSTDPTYLTQLARGLTAPSAPAASTVTLTPGSAPWLLRAHDQRSVIRDLETRFEPMEQVGCHVGIGVATGSDKVFLGDFDRLDVEDSRKLPLAVNRDIAGGRFTWHGMGVLNPWADDGRLVDLVAYPRLATYLEPHREALSRRHTAKGDPGRRWYKTIDRITPSLTWQPKLLVPDIRGDGDAISYDSGTAYPHHNLYYITSVAWDLHALQALLRSGVARLFVDAYAVRIGGGYLRFQAQYLRRIHLPRWATLDAEMKAELQQAGHTGGKVGSPVVERVFGVARGAMSFMDEWEQ